MGQDPRIQVRQPPDFELKCLVGTIRPDRAAIPHLVKDREQFGPLRVLADRETRSNLPTEAMTLARLKRDAKATFSIYETGDVRIQIHRQGSGPACYGSLANAIQGSQPLSRYGDSFVK